MNTSRMLPPFWTVGGRSRDNSVSRRPSSGSGEDENEPWSDIWAVEGATDHLVWQLMRKRRRPEELVTDVATNRGKWSARRRHPDTAGNPTYDRIHLD